MRTSLGISLWALKAFVPQRARRWFRSQERMLRRQNLSSELADWLDRVEPVSRNFGLDRGNPIDRYYIESFLARHAGDIRGHILEVGDDTYARKFGDSHVGEVDIVHLTDDNPKATIVADLTCADAIPSDTFDCIIFTQTLQFIYDVRAAVRTLHRILKPGGILLATFPGISQISRYDMDRWGEYWRFTTLSAQRIFGEVFAGNVTVKAYGNVLTAISFLHGLASEELRNEELNYRDRDYEVVITVRAVKLKNPS
jgi:SAM-dependent methyltransferase